MTKTPQAPARVRRRYLGPLATVLVFLPSGRSLTVARGEDVEVLASEATVLDRLPGWEPTPDPDPDAPESATTKEN